MATSTVSYYFTGYSSASSWFANPASACDGSLATYAEATSSATLDLSTNASGAGLGVITKVEYRVYFYAQKMLSNNMEFRVQPEFGGTSLGTKVVLANATHPLAWSAYRDITTDTNAPVWGQNWTHINNLDINLEAWVDRTISGPDCYVRPYEVEIRVTYIPWAGFQVI